MEEVLRLRNILFRAVMVLFCILLGNSSLHAQSITASFTPDAAICGSAVVDFNATVTGSIPISDLSFDWDFGDGKPITNGQNVSHGFPVTPGSTHTQSFGSPELPFHVVLTVTQISVNKVVATVTKDVIVRPAPIPILVDAINPLKPFDNCASNPTVQNPNYTVTVNNQSQDVNTISGYQIDWGDGSVVTAYTRTDFPVTHNYTKLGLFRLKFTATGVNGCTATQTYTVKNQGNPGIGIVSGGNTSGCAPITFAFKIKGVSNNDAQTTYVWDFGDGIKQTWTTDSINMKDSTVFHTYTTGSCTQPNGYYVVKITATNACQSTEASVGGVRVGVKPIPSFKASNLCEGEDVNFQNTTMPGSNFDCSVNVLYLWNFGDGSPIVQTTSSTPLQHTFPTTTNVYTVKLTALNDCKDSAYYSQQITLIRRPVANATLSPVQGCAPLTVTATDASTGDITTRTWSVTPATGWSFAPGSNANSVNPQFIFTTKGNYIVTLQVKNTCATNEKRINVFVNGPLDATFPDIGNQCNAYTFDATVPGVFTVNTIPNETVQANWTITPSSGFTFLNGTTAQSLYPQIQFNTEGDYTLAVNLDNGCSTKSFTKTFRFASTPKAVATPSVTAGCIPIDTVHFNNQSTGYKISSNWTVTPSTGVSFINGTSTTSSNPDLKFTQAGNYTVKLTVSNQCGTDSKSFSITAKDQPTVTFTSLNDMCEGGTFNFNSAYLNVANNNGGTPVYAWSITPNTGFTYVNSTSSTSANPSIQFQVAGTYQVSVTVSNDCGSVTKTQSLNVRQAVRLITTISDTIGCAPKSISFTDNSAGIQLTHQWTVTPSTGYIYTTGNATSASPTMQFTQAGTYTITHTVNSLCGTQSKIFKVQISSSPIITLSPIPNQCSLPFNLNIDSTKFNVNRNGNAVTNLRWWVTPSTGVSFTDGTSETSQYPHITFTNSGQYTLWVQAQNNCNTTTASQIFWIPEHAVEQSTSTALTGCLPLTINFTDQSKGDQLTHTWSVVPAAGWTLTPSASAASPKIVFNAVGTYTVTHLIKNSCGSDSKQYTVKVKDVPSVTLGLKPSSCNSYKYVADNVNMKLKANLNDTISFLWTINPAQGVSYLNGTSDTSHYPVIAFADTGVYYVKVRTTGECGFSETHQIIGITQGPQIMLTPSLSAQCLPSDLTFAGQVYGQNLAYNWTVAPSAGAMFINNTSATSALPQIRFSQPGNYSVSLNVSNNCSNDIRKWDFTIIGKPTIVFNPVADTCDNFTFRAERYVNVQDNGNAITSYNWTVTPSTGFSFVDGTSPTSPLPHIFFTDANTYKLTMNATNGCGTTPISQSFTLDQFVQVQAGADTTICTNNSLLPLKGIPDGGSWTILPATASNVLKLIGSSYYLDLNIPGNYTLTYKRGNNYCSSENNRHINVLSLPAVDAGRDITLCVNDTTFHQLTGTPSGGSWSGTGITGNAFSAKGLTAVSYILKYTYTDPATSCTNTDQLVARLLAVPATGFTAASQGCKDAPMLFTPNGTTGTVYNWDFGDGQTAISSGTINHTYRTAGTYTAKMVSADPNNCSITSSLKITILGDITLPVVSVNPAKGCGPLTVNFKVDTTGTTGNGQHYSWNFGNGQVQDGPFTSKNVIYNQGLADTTYNAILTVSNSCFSRTMTFPVTVNALPNANFALPHGWECSPKIVSIKNLSIDRSARFFWDFGDGTTSTAYEPSHTFSTGKTATTYMIKLVAQNACGKDSITRPLLIKPNSIDAFIQLNTRQACPGVPISFTNLSTDTVMQIMNYYWDFGDGTVVNSWNATHAYAAQGKYIVKLFVDNGCSSGEKTDSVQIFAPLTISIISPDSVCLSESVNMQGKSPTDELINAKWDFGDNSFATGNLASHTFMTPGWNNVTFTAASASNMSHCTGSVVKHIFVKDLPTAIPVNDIEGCSPLTLNLKPAGIEPQLWNFGEDSVWSSSGKYTYINDNNDNKPIRRKVSIVTENKLGCHLHSYFWVTIYPVPRAKIRLNSEGGSPENVFLSSLSTNSTACQWLFPDGSSSQDCDSVLVKFYNNGFYKIQLRSSNQYGCWDTTSMVHETIIKGLFVPNAFQPSNSDPQVKTFKPVGIGLKSYWMGIYDTWGNPIWETTKLTDTQPAEGWNGSTVIGKKLPMDVYIWRIKAVFIDGTEWKGMKGRDGILRTEGTVTLIK